MDDVDIVDKLFEQQFGDEFREYASRNNDHVLLRSSSSQHQGKSRKRRKVRGRSRFESPYQQYPPRGTSIKYRPNSSTRSEASVLTARSSRAFPPMNNNNKRDHSAAIEINTSKPEPEEKTPEEKRRGGRTSPLDTQPSVFELMQETIPPPLFSNDTLITKSLSLPYMEQLEYIRLHLGRRGMYEPGHLHDEEFHKAHPDSEDVLKARPHVPVPVRYVLGPGYDADGSAAAEETKEGDGDVVVEDIEREESAGFDDRMSTATDEDDLPGKADLPPREISVLDDPPVPADAPFRMHEAMGRYAHFTSFLECNRIVKAQRRQTAWILELIEEIYDERYKFEFTEFEGEAPPQHPLTSLVPRQFQSLGQDKEGNPELQAPSVSTAVFVYQHLSKIFGLKAIVDQICWDILYTVTLLEDDFREIRLFSMFLREIWDENVMIFKLFCRNNIQSLFPVRFKLKGKIIEHVPQMHMPPEAIVVEKHPMNVYGQKLLRLSPWSCRKLFDVVFDKNTDLSAYLLWRLRDDFVPQLDAKLGRLVKPKLDSVTPTIDAVLMLEKLVEVFMSCPDDIIQSIKYSDAGGTLFMLTKLKQTAHCDKKVEEVRLQLLEEMREYQSQEVVVQKLKQNDTTGAKRTAIFLAENELWRLQQIVSLSEAKLIEVRQMEDNIWNDVIDTDKEAIQVRKKNKKKHSSVPSDLINLDMAVQRFIQWIERQQLQHERHLKSMAVLNVSWEEQMEKVRLKAIIRIQRRYRERRDARIAKEHADIIANAKREKRKREMEKKKAREAAIKKRRIEQERKHQERINREKREEEERVAKLKARQRAIVEKHQKEEAEARFQAHVRQSLTTFLAYWKKFTGSARLKKKVFRSEFQRRINLWKEFHALRREWHAKQDVAARAIQRCFRAFHARNVLKHIKAYHKKQEESIRMNLIRLQRHLEHRILVKWHAYAYQQHGIRRILRDHFSHVLHSCWHDWVQFTHLSIEENNAAATKLQAMQRARVKRREYNEGRRRRHAALVIQGAYRAHLAKNMLRNAKRHFEREERRALRAVGRMAKAKEARVFHKWHDHVRKLKNVRRFMHDLIVSGERKSFHTWQRYTKYTKEKKEAAAILVQRRYKEMKAHRLYKEAVRKSNAAIIIQKYGRQYLQSRTLEWLILYRDAATTIQRFVRGDIGRRLYRAKRQANYFKAAYSKDFWICNKAFERREGHLLDREGNSMLMWAARGGSKRIIKLCLRNNMDINAINSSGQNAMMQLIAENYYGQEVILDYMLSKGGNAKSQDFTGSSPLMEAARLGRIDCMKLLLKCNADVNHTDYNGCTVLQVAAAANQITSVNMLLKHKVDVDQKDHDGATVLHDVAARGRWRMLEHLLQYCSSCDHQDNDGHTPLHLAIFGGHAECTRLLVINGADTNTIDDTGRSQLIHAVEDENFEFVQLLSEADTDLNIQDRDGETALHIAATRGFSEMTKILLGNGADPMIRNHDGNSALHLAAQQGHVECITLLIDYHASINFVNFDNRTPLGEARIRNHKGAVEVFNKRFIDDRIAQRKFEVAFALNSGLPPPPAPEEPAWKRICRGLTKSQWQKVRELSSFERKIHMWLEMSVTFNNLDTVVKLPRITDNIDSNEGVGEKKKFWEHGEELQEKIKEELNQVIVYWYYDHDEVYTVDKPQDVQKGVWVQEEVKIMGPADPDYPDNGEMVPTGETKLVWKNKVTGQESDVLPPMLVETRNTKRPRLHAVLGKADITKNEYKEYYQKEMGDILQNRAEVQSAVFIQRIFRGYRMRVFYAQHKKRWYASIHAQRIVRGFLGRCHARELRRRRDAAIAIQSGYRGMLDRVWIGENYYYMWRRRAVWRAVHLINRVWRGYVCRRWKRRYLWKKRGPQFFDEWQEVRRLSIIRRVLGVWDEMIYADTYDVIFYCNHLTKKCQWDKPLAVFNHDQQQLEDDRQLRLHGFTRREKEVAMKLQGIWRGRQAMRIFRQMVRGAKIMKTCENDFLSNPDKIEHLCNYTLYLHTVRLDYDHARIMYARMLEYMTSRGPDNAFVLYAYACFATATREADFDDVIDMVMRARDAEPKTGTHCFDLAEKGFFRQAMVFNPGSAQANANYAICQQFVRRDYKTAEEYYLRACKLDPYDHTITYNFNDMLKRLAHKKYDGYEAFMKSQVADAEREAAELAKIIESDEYQINKYKHEAAAVIQRAYRRKKGVKVFWKFQGMPESLKLAREHEEFHKFTGHDENLEDIADWEECSDGLGKIYYFNTKTNESRWEKPQFLQAGIKLKRGPGFDGMRIGRLENVEDWEECRDATGNNYYYNNKNGKSQWTRPRFRNEGDHPKKGMGFGDAHEEHLEDENHGHGTAKRSDWHEHKDNAGRVYWYNDKTGESQWLQPHFMSEDEEIELHHQEMEEKTKNIPEGWEAQQDAKGNYYYFCLTTGESAWEKPTEKCVPPPGWETVKNEDGTVYFYNKITGDSRWELKGLMDYTRNA